MPEIAKELVPSIAEQVKTAQVEAAKPQIRMSVEAMSDLTNRAGVVGLECKSKTTDMILAGKTENEVQRFIIDEHEKNRPAGTGSTGAPGAGDGTMRSGTPTGTVSPAIPGQITSFSQINDEQFRNTILNPTSFPM